MDLKLFNSFTKKIKLVKTLDQLRSLYGEYLGRKSLIRSFFKELPALPIKEKKKIGPLLQKKKEQMLQLYSQKERELEELEAVKKLEADQESLAFNLPKIGHLHPITRTIREMNTIFYKMGFSIMDGPEIETDEYCFQRLNVPQGHPARDMQDTIYLQEPQYLLRTQTSSIEARALEKYSPPLRIICPGRVYRNEKVNKSNHFIFHHYQGVVVEQKVSLKDLFGILTLLFKKMYGPKVVIRYRNKYYPEVEPGVGPDMQCFICKGRGCAVCKNVGWIEMGGAGIIHPRVLEMAGIDHREWRGFAFGLGLDRWVMAKYQIDDIRTLLSGNLGYKYFENEGLIQSN